MYVANDGCLGRGCRVLCNTLLRYCVQATFPDPDSSPALCLPVDSVRGPFSPFLGPGPSLVCALAPELSRIVRPLASLGKA